MGTRFLRIRVRLTISMFHQSNRIKTTSEIILLCLSLLVILSHISHIHNLHIIRQVRALLRQHLLTRTIPGLQARRHPLCLLIQPSTMTLILTTNRIHIMAMGWLMMTINSNTLIPIHNPISCPNRMVITTIPTPASNHLP